jgi:integrase
MSAPVTMQARAANYLSERRRLGFGLCSTGYAVMSFARHVDGLGHHGPLTVEVMADWARRDQWHSDEPATWARRLKKLRSFARYLQQFEPRTEVPDDFTFGRIGQRLAPHIYSEQEIVDLLAAARRLGPTPGLRGATYEALFGLIASTGLRVSEAVHLLDADVDLKLGTLVIRRTKFAKSRQVSLHSSAVQALLRYRRVRNRYVEVTDETPFFVGTRGKRLGHSIHDLRHAFIVRRVMLWHTQGVDVDQAMLALSTYVGHAMVTNIYWYLTGVPQLMAVAVAKFESFMQAPEVPHA